LASVLIERVNNIQTLGHRDYVFVLGVFIIIIIIIIMAEIAFILRGLATSNE